MQNGEVLNLVIVLQFIESAEQIVTEMFGNSSIVGNIQ